MVFPIDTLSSVIASVQAQSEIDTTVKTSLSFDFDKKEIPVIDGNPVTNAGIEATKQWIRLFFRTDRDYVPVYKGKKFGTSIRKLIGLKALNNGYEESEVEREIREGFPLCPTIKRVTSFNMSKSGKILSVKVATELQDGTIIEHEEKISV